MIISGHSIPCWVWRSLSSTTDIIMSVLQLKLPVQTWNTWHIYPFFANNNIAYVFCSFQNQDYLQQYVSPIILGCTYLAEFHYFRVTCWISIWKKTSHFFFYSKLPNGILKIVCIFHKLNITIWYMCNTL